MAGINTKIKYKNTFFHIQTQDVGSKANYIESLIYKSGKILTSRKTSYASYLSSPDLKKQINQLMKKQHLAVINEISGGRFDHYLSLPEKPELSQEEPLELNSSAEKLKIEDSRSLEINLVHFSIPTSSSPLCFSLEVRQVSPPNPVAFLNITARVITETDKEYILFKGITDEEGKLTLGLHPPQIPDKIFSLFIKAEKEGFEPDEIKIFLKKE